MKKIFPLVLLLATMLTTAAWSQVSFGIKAGLNISNQAFSFSSGGITISPKPLVGFHGGVYLNAKFGKFGIQPEAYYSMQGSKFEDSGSTVKFNFNYINVPILLRYNVTDFLNLHLGPQFGILMSAKATDGSQTLDIKEDVKTLDVSIAAGIGVDLPFGLSGGARYVAGLTNIEKDNPDGEKLKNSIIQIYLGYRLFGK